MKKTSGFTLIELAIVLVIIGLLLGGVLKGQELINSAKVKNMANDFRNIQVQIYSYQDKFRALPGDDKAATAHLGSQDAINGNGNGVIEGTWDGKAPSGQGAVNEALNVWKHLRLAGLAAGSIETTDASYFPTNAEGGKIGIQSRPDLTISGLTGSYAICSEGILGKFVKQLDSTLDDGNPATGSVRAAASVNGTTATTPVGLGEATGENAQAAFNDSAKYTVCMAF